MAKITKDMIPPAYDVAKKVYEGTLGVKEGMEEITRLTGMTPGSTTGFITDFRAMMEGTRYARTLNLYATEYYLEHIGQDYGREQQKIAARAVKKHVEYYRTKACYLKSADELADKYL